MRGEETKGQGLWKPIERELSIEQIKGDQLFEAETSRHYRGESFGVCGEKGWIRLADVWPWLFVCVW